VVIDSNVVPPKPDWRPERIEAQRPKWQAHHRWMVQDLCRHKNNPNKLPTIVFLHHPEYMTGDRGMESRPLGRVLAACPDQHRLKAVFGGHWHNGENLGRDKSLGIDVYATQATVHGITSPVEFIVAEAGPERLTFQTRDTKTGQPVTSKVIYHPIAGRFTDFRKE